MSEKIEIGSQYIFRGRKTEKIFFSTFNLTFVAR